MTGSLLEIRGLSVELTRDAPLKVPDGIDISLAAGEILGIAGESGAGKSVTGAAVMRLMSEPLRQSGGAIGQIGAHLNHIAPAGTGPGQRGLDHGKGVTGLRDGIGGEGTLCGVCAGGAREEHPLAIDHGARILRHFLETRARADRPALGLHDAVSLMQDCDRLFMNVVMRQENLSARHGTGA